MKFNLITINIFMVVSLFLWGNISFAQQESTKSRSIVYTSDFESYTAEQQVACNDNTGFWTTINNSPCGSEDADISTEFAYSGANSVKNYFNYPVLTLGDKTSGKFKFSFYIYLPEWYGGYYYLYHDFDSLETAAKIYFSDWGVLKLWCGGESSTVNYTYDQWQKVTQIIDLDNDEAQFYLDDQLLLTWQWSLQNNGDPGQNKLSAIEFLSDDGTNWCESPLYYIDDIGYEEVVEDPSIYASDFESYIAGQQVACDDNTGFWTTINNSPCGSEDADMSTEYAHSGVNSVKNYFNYPVLTLGDKTSGMYNFSFWIYLPEWYGGYCYLFHDFGSQEIGAKIYFSDWGVLKLWCGGESSTVNYTYDQWQKVTQIIDLDNDEAQFYLDDQLLLTWQWSLQNNGDPGQNKLSAIEFLSDDGTNWCESPLYYIDDIDYSIYGQGSGNLTGTITMLAGSAPVGNALVTIFNESSGLYSATTSSDGTYEISDAGVGIYELAVEKDGFNIITDIISIQNNQTVTRNYQLTAPEISVDPGSLSVTVPVGDTVTSTLTLNNTGNGPLEWRGYQLNNIRKIPIPASDGKFVHSPATDKPAPASNQVNNTNNETDPVTVLLSSSKAYACQFNPGSSWSSFLISFDTDDPYNLSIEDIIEINNPYGGAFDARHTDWFYVIEGLDKSIKKVDIATGNITTVGPTGLSDGYTPTGLTCDKTTGILYLSADYGNTSYIFTINPETGAATVVGETGIYVLIDITIDGTGQMYGYSVVDDNAYKIDKLTGEATVIGSIGFDANYAQSMEWDPVSDNIYLAAFTSSEEPQFRIMDRETGNTSLIGPLRGETDVLVFPGGGATWVSIEPQTGVIEAGQTQTITVSFDGNYFPPQGQQKGLTLGCNLTFISSNPDVGQANVELSMTIDGDFYGALSGLVTHVGTPLEGVDIKAIRQEDPIYIYSMVTGTDGTYAFPETMKGTYDITAVKEGYNPYLASDVDIIAGQTTNHNISMLAPTMAIDSSSITATTPYGQIITRTIHISNDGDGTLEWAGNCQTGDKQQISIPPSDGNFEHSPAILGIAPEVNTTDAIKTGLGIRGSTAYGFDLTNSTFIQIDTDDPTNTTTIASITIKPYGGTFDAVHADFMYVIDGNDNMIKKVNVATGLAITIGSPGISGDDTPAGLACDKTTGTLYLSTTNSNDSRIYTVDTETGVASLIGSTGLVYLIDIAIDGTGQMYGYTLSDNAYLIDKTTGEATLIGSIGFDANFAQGMCWDPVSDQIYLAAFNLTSNSGELRILDRMTGNTALVGTLPGEVDGFAFPGTSWLTMNPRTGFIPAGNTVEITVTLDGNYMASQKDYTLNGIIAFTSDPDVGSIDIPVSFTVESDYGILAGMVSHGLATVSGATVTASREGSPVYTYSATTGAGGIYSLPEIVNGYYTISCSKQGYNVFTATGIYITGGQTTTFDIQMTAPVMSVNPVEINETVAFSEITTATLTISNTGDGEMEWESYASDTENPRISIPASEGNFEHSCPSNGITTNVNKPKKTTCTIQYMPKGTFGYAFNINPDNTFFSFDTDDPSNPNVICSISMSPFGATFDAVHEDFMYIIDGNDNYIKKVDVETGNVITVGLAGFEEGFTASGLTCDKTTGILYASCTNGGESLLYTIDPVTGAGTLVGNTWISTLIDITIDGNGQMYGIDIAGDNAYKIYKEYGFSELIGSIGFDANYAQGMSWDPVSDNIYLAAFNGSSETGELRILDRETGNTALIGAFYGEIDGLAFPGAISSWLSVEPRAGALSPGETQQLTVTLNGNYPPPGKGYTLTGSFSFLPDPDVGMTVIPVQLSVEGDAYGALTGTVTHNGSPVGDVTIKAIRGEIPVYTYSTITDDDGQFSFPQTLGGTYTVTVQATGYNPFSTTNIAITGGQTTTLTITLNAPVMNITPVSITDTLLMGYTSDHTIVINNTGDGSLEWTVTIQKDGTQPISIPTSNGQFQRGNAPVYLGPALGVYSDSYSGSTDFLSGSTAYAFDLNNHNFLSFNATTPAMQHIISEVTYEPYGGTFDVANTDYMYVIVNDHLKKVDIATGSLSDIGYCALYSGQTYWTGIQVDKTKNQMYGISSNLNESYLYIIDMNTAETTVIGPTGIPGCIDIAIDGTGQIYGVDIMGDNAYKINKQNGEATLLGSLGFDANCAQGMSWDPETDIVYLAAYNMTSYNGELRILDRNTGNTQLIGVLGEGNEVDAMGFPGFLWISVDEASGSVAPGASGEITLHLNAKNLEEGVYDASIIFNSNPDVGTVTIPVTLVVTRIVGIENVDVDKTIKIYPNPADDKIMISLGNENFQAVCLMIFDTKGQKILKTSFSNETIIDVNNLRSGIYYFQLLSDKLNEVRKVVIR